MRTLRDNWVYNYDTKEYTNVVTNAKVKKINSAWYFLNGGLKDSRLAIGRSRNSALWISDRIGISKTERVDEIIKGKLNESSIEFREMFYTLVFTDNVHYVEALDIVSKLLGEEVKI